MRRFEAAVLVSVMTVGFASIASAADIAVKTSTMESSTEDWTGFYLGGNMGYGWENSTGTFANAAGFFPVPYDAHPNGPIGGGFAGYNYQIDRWVLGVEGDWQISGSSGSDIGTTSGGSYKYVMNSKIENWGSLRGRFAYVVDSWLLFVTGGWAIGNISTDYSIAGDASPFYTNTFTGNGWTAGTGIEYAVASNWLARAEYRYTDLGSGEFRDTSTNSSESDNHVTASDVRLGIAYKF